MIIPAQSRAARALVEWSQEQLAEASHLGLSTIRDFEKGRRVPTHNNLVAIERALEGAGVVFMDEGDITQGGPGVRLTVSHPSQQVTGITGKPTGHDPKVPGLGTRRS